MGASASGMARPQMGGTERTGLTMPKKTLPRIATVSSDKKPMTLRILWDNGDRSFVDVSGLVETFRAYEPLRRSPELFRKVRLGEHGVDVVWNDEVDMAAETLWRLAQEQAGMTMSPEAFRHWRERKAYTLDTAARALGLSRRMVAYYENGAKPIPRVVALAARALELA
jgi:DNA-binding transcriptional regulator YiaG